jgi:hypothetical protein
VRYEFIAPLPPIGSEVRWLVRDPAGDVLRVVWAIEDRESAWLDQVDRATHRWLSFAHPRVSRVHGKARLDNQLVVTVDDDRGPSYADAAVTLADTPVDREGWAVAQLITIADGLAAMANHEPGFIHRKLEPARLFVDAAGHARLRAPIGLVSVGPDRGYTGQGRVLGTLGYISPEQCRGMKLTPASDVFALAANLVRALTGHSPFVEEKSPMETLQAIVFGATPACPTYAPGLDRVVARAFAKEPAKRYPDPAAFAAELYECVPDAGDYDAVISDRIAAWRPTAPEAHTEHHRGPACVRRWEDLVAGGDENIRHCTSCQQPVVQVRSIAAAVPLLGRHCVAFRPG